MNQPHENPFEAPADYSVASSATIASEQPFSMTRVLAKWFAICCVSAGPSFLFGLVVADSQYSQVAGMVAGVATFIVTYTIIECQPQVRSLIRKRFIRKTAQIGYGMRMLISVVFPLGAYIDIPTGVLSVSIANFLFGKGRGEFANQFDSHIISFLWFYSTTIIQGILLNAILLAFMAIIYGTAVLVSRARFPA